MPYPIDIDFSQQPFSKGYIPDTEILFRSVATELRLIPESEWQNYSQLLLTLLPSYVATIKDQKSEGSCVGNAVAKAVEIRYNYSVGVADFIKLSAISLYKACGSTPGSGSTISCNVNRATNVGILPSTDNTELNRFKCTFPDTGFYTPYPENFQEEAKNFRILEAYSVNTIQEFVSCLFLGWPVIYARNGHCICAIAYKPGYIIYVNSWGKDWGENGLGMDSLSLVQRNVRGSVAVKSVTLHPTVYTPINPQRLAA